MDELEAGHRGFMIAVVVFWLLAGGLLGTAFVLYQEAEQTRLHAEAMEAEAHALATKTVPLEREADKLRKSLDADVQSDGGAIAAVRTAVGHAPHLRAALLGADRRAADLKGEVALLTLTRDGRQAQLARAQAEQRTAQTTHDAAIRDIERRTSDRTAQINQRISELNAQVSALTTRLDELDAQATSERDVMLRNRIEYERTLKILLEKRKRLKDELRLTLAFRPQTVGHVLGADISLAFAYIDLGQEHGVVEGMRFSVYPADVVFAPGVRPKAVLEIKRADQRRSQARIAKQSLSDPVVTGDILVNIALDPAGRKPTFVLVRFLDIDGDNVDDRDDIIRIITGQGGKVLPPDPIEVTVDTDFILIGEEWDRASPAQAPYAERDDEVLDKADRRSVTRLDVASFLNYVGFPKWK